MVSTRSIPPHQSPKESRRQRRMMESSDAATRDVICKDAVVQHTVPGSGSVTAPDPRVLATTIKNEEKDPEEHRPNADLQTVMDNGDAAVAESIVNVPPALLQPPTHATTIHGAGRLPHAPVFGASSASSLSPIFILYFSFETSTGTKSFKVLHGDLMKTHHELTCQTLKNEAGVIMKLLKGQEEDTMISLGLEYKDPYGVIISIEQERDLRYALADYAEKGRITLFVKPTVSTVAPPPVVAAAAAVVTPTKKRASPKPSTTKPRKKAATVPRNAAAAPAPRNGAATQPVPVPAPSAQLGVVPAPQPMPAPSNEVAQESRQQLDTLSGAAQKVYMAVVKFHTLGIRNPQRKHVALLAGYSNTDKGMKSFGNVLSVVKQKGFVDYTAEKTLQLTEDRGLSCMPPAANRPGTNQEMKQLVAEVVKSPKVMQVYERLFDGRVHDRVALAQEVGYTTDNQGLKNFGNKLSVLGGLGFSEYPDKKTVRLTDLAFPFGRPV